MKISLPISTDLPIDNSLSRSDADNDPVVSQNPLQSRIILMTEPRKYRIPELTIIEQPAQHYRFRYPSELDVTRIGGLLTGRSSDDTSKSYMRVQISGIDATMHSLLRLVVCTVSSDKGPHPYNLHGDNCHDGYFEIDKSIDEKSPSVWSLSFSRLAVICFPRNNKEALDRAVEAGKWRFSQLIYSSLKRDEASVKTPTGKRSLGTIRLAFSLMYRDHNFETLLPLPTVYSDEICDEKDKKLALSIDCLNPTSVPQGCSTELAVYTTNSTNGMQKNELKVLFSFSAPSSTADATEQQTSVECDVIEMKKHLLIVKTPSISSPEPNLGCLVSVRNQEFQSREHLELTFCGDERSNNFKGEILGVAGSSRKTQE